MTSLSPAQAQLSIQGSFSAILSVVGREGLNCQGYSHHVLQQARHFSILLSRVLKSKKNHSVVFVNIAVLLHT